MTEYEILFDEIFTMANADDYANAVHHLNDNQLITEAEYQLLWDILCDIHNRFLAEL